MKHIFYIFTFLCFTQPLIAQVDLEFFGLDGQQLTALDINFGIIAVGTDRNGVNWQFEPSATDTGWMHIRMDSSVQAVYPHKSGPIGWAISAGIYPATGEPPYIFCSFTGGDFEANSSGIEPSMTFGIADIDGFPDPSICGETFAVGERALYRRYFNDTIWQPVFVATIEGFIQTVKVRQAYPGVVLLGGADGFAGTLMARSNDFGETWQDISPPGMIFGIDFAGATADTIFAAASNQILRTSDGGATWDVVFMDGLAFHLSEILYDAEQQTVFAAGGNLPGGEALLLMSIDFGESWQQIPLNNLGTIRGLEFGNDDWKYFITRDEGVFRFREGTSGVDDSERINTISLEQNYPNPFSIRTTIEYTIPAASEVILKVVSAIGEEVAVLVKERKQPGKYSINWDASNLGDGVYIITLKAAGQSATRKALFIHS